MLKRSHTSQHGRSKIGLLMGLTAAVLAAGIDTPASAASVGSVAGVVHSALADDGETNLATNEEKSKAAELLGIPTNRALLGLNDQSFVLALWRGAKDDTGVKGEALHAYLESIGSNPEAAHDFITAGVFAAQRNDDRAEIEAAEAKARRRQVAVQVGLDPTDTAIVEKNDRDFIIVVWQRAQDGSHVQAAARHAFREGSAQEDWTAFLTTEAKLAAQQDFEDSIRNKDEAEQARLRAEQLRRAKTALLNLLQLPVTTVLLDAPNREFVLDVKNNAAAPEVKLAAQEAVNASGAELEKALQDFIFTGGGEAYERDQAAADAKTLASYRLQVSVILDVARRDGYQLALVTAAQQALKDNTLLSLQRFLLRDQEAALRADMPAPANLMTVLLKGAQSGRCASVAGAVDRAADTDGTKVVLFDCHASTTQRWNLNLVTADRYTVQSVNSKMCLNNAAKAVVQTKCNTTDTDQLWRFQVLPNGLFQVRNVASGLMLSHENGKTANQIPLTQQPMGDDKVTNEQWRLIDTSRSTANLEQNGVVKLTLANARCLTGAKENGKQLEALGRGQCSQWKLTDKGNRTYELADAVTGLCVDLKGRNAKPNAVGQVWTCNGTPAQRWSFRTGKDGAVKLVSALTGAALSDDVLEPLPKNATPVQLAERAAEAAKRAACGCEPVIVNPDNNGSDQQWKLTAVK